MSQEAQTEIQAGDGEVGINRIEPQDGHTDIHSGQSGQHAAGINQMAFEIFPPEMTFGFKDEILIAQKGIGNRNDMAQDTQKQVMFLGENQNQNSIEPQTEDSIPKSNQTITDAMLKKTGPADFFYYFRIYH